MIMKPTWLNGCSLCSIGCFLRFKWGHAHCMLISTGFPGSRLWPFKSSQFILDDGTFLVLFNRKKYRVWKAHIITVHTTIKFLRVTKCLLFSICCTGCCKIQNVLTEWDVWGVISLWPINPIGRFPQGALAISTAKLEILALFWSCSFFFLSFFVYIVQYCSQPENKLKWGIWSAVVVAHKQSIRLVDFFQRVLTSW